MTDRELMKQVMENICGAKLCEINSMSSRQEMERLLDKAIDSLRDRLAQPERYGSEHYRDMYLKVRDELAALQQRQWVGMTRENMAELRRAGLHSISDKAFEVIANFLKEKNGG
jgi:hypothetical protein